MTAVGMGKANYKTAKESLGKVNHPKAEPTEGTKHCLIFIISEGREKLIKADEHRNIKREKELKKDRRTHTKRA